MKIKFCALALLCVLLTACTPNGTVQTYTLPDPHDVVMYEVNPRVFAQTGSFKVITQRLDSIRQLGVNVLWLMPVYEQGIEKAKASPYCIKDYKAINTEYGTLDEFKTLIDKAHEKGMSVIMDWVANHTSWDNAWLKEHPEWYTHDEQGNIVWPPTTNWEDVADLDFSNADMRLAMIDAMRYWVEECGIDGYRCDAADFVPFDFWKQAVSAMRAIEDKNLLLLAEGKRADHFDAGFDMNYAWDYMGANRDVYQNDSSAVKLFVTDKAEYDTIPAGKVKLRFITNHDEAAAHSPVEEYGGLRASLSAFVETITIRGGALLYGSQEVGYDQPLNFFKWKPIDWMSNPEVYNEYRQILTAYNEHKALRRGSLVGYMNPDAMVFTKSLNGDSLLVMANVRNREVKVTLPLSWKNREALSALDGTPVPLAGEMVLQPYQYYILQRKD